jgi:hypothetical protein
MRDPFTEDDLNVVEARFFVIGLDGHGLLSNVVMFRGSQPRHITTGGRRPPRGGL